MGKTEKIKTLLTNIINRVSISNKHVISGIALSSGVIVFHYAKKNKFSFRKIIKYTRSKIYSQESDSESEESHDSENIHLELTENNTTENEETESKSFLGKILFSKN